MHRTHRTIIKSLTIPALSAAVLLVACDRDREPTAPPDPVGGLEADLTSQNLSVLTAQFLANQPLIPDGSITQDEAPSFGHTIHVIDRDNKGGWKIQGSTEVITFDDEFTCDFDQAPPLPPGALQLFSPPPSDQYARLRSTRYHRTYLRDLSRLDYHACDEVNSSQWPYIVLSIDWDGDNQINESIIFEPSYQNPAQGGACGAESAQPVPLMQEWQFWDGLRGTPGDPTTFKACWYSTCAYKLPMPDPGCVPFPPGPGIQSLSTYITAHPDAAIVNLDGNHGGVQISHGEVIPPDVGYKGWVDAFTIGKDINNTSGQTLNSTITYDFQKQ
jgi:hypothetical protein